MRNPGTLQKIHFGIIQFGKYSLENTVWKNTIQKNICYFEEEKMVKKSVEKTVKKLLKKPMSKIGGKIGQKIHEKAMKKLVEKQ